MTKDEIKSLYSMREIVSRYGIRIDRAGFVCCPFHKEKTASLKLYEKSYFCFGCHATGDIFDFIMKQEGISFKDAFQSLGGTYEKPTMESKRAIYRSKKRLETLANEKRRKQEDKRYCTNLISIYQRTLRTLEPLSDEYAQCYNWLQYQLYKFDYLSGEEVESAIFK